MTDSSLNLLTFVQHIGAGLRLLQMMCDVEVGHIHLCIAQVRSAILILTDRIPPGVSVLQFVDISLVFPSHRLVFPPIEKQSVTPVKVTPALIDTSPIDRHRLDGPKVVGYCVEPSNLFVLRIWDLFDDVVVWGLCSIYPTQP
jgi:hypothetical protein